MKQPEEIFKKFPTKYQAFFNRFAEIDTIPLSDYKPVHLIAYFCRKFEGAYQSSYQFKFNSPSPTKSFEVFQIKKLAQILSSRPEILIPYIEWIFLEKIPKTKAPIRSISFLTKEENVQEYKRIFLNSGRTTMAATISRSTRLPDKFEKIMLDREIHAETFGDLAFLFQSQNWTHQLEKAFEDLKREGFDLESLRKIV